LIDAADPDCEGAPPPGPTLEERVASLEALVTALQAELAAHKSDLVVHHARYSDTEAINAVGPHNFSHAALTDVSPDQHHVKYSDAEAVAAVEAAGFVVGPHSPDFSSLLSGVSRLDDPNTGYDTFRFTGMNVQIINGSGQTYWTNGLGNLIIGYNAPRDENRAGLPCPSDVDHESYCNRRTGSHMLIIGERNNYTAFGGIVSGVNSEAAGEYGSVTGGQTNIARGRHTLVAGGANNFAIGENAVVAGGAGNFAYATTSTIVGGIDNETNRGEQSAVFGGEGNVAEGVRSAVLGGFGNYTAHHIVPILHTVVVGGVNNNASAAGAVVVGGEQNTTYGSMSVITGGQGNLTQVLGQHAVVGGGRENVAYGHWSVVGGGYQRETGNTAPANEYDWVAGALFEDQ
jgi:hypothetical protein